MLDNDTNNIHESLSNELIQAFDSTINEIISTTQPVFSNRLPSEIRDEYEASNLVLLEDMELVPGKLGILAATPQITQVIKNCIYMIFELFAVMKGDSSSFIREFALGILLDAYGIKKHDILQNREQSNETVVLKIDDDMVYLYVKKLAERIAYQIIHMMVAVGIPEGRTLSLGHWAVFYTRCIFNITYDLLAKKEIAEGALIAIQTADDEYIGQSKDAASIETSMESLIKIADEIRIQTLINLMKIDDVIQEEEIAYLDLMLEIASITEMKRNSIRLSYNTPQLISIDYSPIKGMVEFTIPLLIDMVTLSRIDNSFDNDERLYISEVGEKLGVDHNNINVLLALN